MLQGTPCGGMRVIARGTLDGNINPPLHVFLCAAVEDQAMDRIHRLGQYRPIQVTRIVVENSIESRIIQLQVCASSVWTLFKRLAHVLVLESPPCQAPLPVPLLAEGLARILCVGE